jgi:hypothetical protein
MQYEDYRNKISGALSVKAGKVVVIESEGPFGPFKIIVDGALKIISSSSFEGVSEKDAVENIFEMLISPGIMSKQSANVSI